MFIVCIFLLQVRKFHGVVLTSATLLKSPKKNKAAVARKIKICGVFFSYLLSELLAEKNKIFFFYNFSGWCSSLRWQIFSRWSHGLWFSLQSCHIKDPIRWTTANCKCQKLGWFSSVCPSIEHNPGSKHYLQLPQHSRLFNLLPDDSLIAIGRYFEEQYNLMIAPGIFR